MTKHRTGTREEWRAARLALLEREKELTRLSDELARKRQRLPWVRVDKTYMFDTEEGPRRRSPSSSTGARSCSSTTSCSAPTGRRAASAARFWPTTSTARLVHLEQRDVSFVCVSRAPLEKLLAYKQRMGWRFPGVSSYGQRLQLRLRRLLHTLEQLQNGAEHAFRWVEGSKLHVRVSRARAHSRSRTASPTTPSPPVRPRRRRADLTCIPAARPDTKGPKRRRASLPLGYPWWRRHDEYEDEEA